MKTKDGFTGMLEILVCVPGMEENVKLGLSLKRKQAMLLSNVIREGLKAVGGMVADLLEVLPPESVQELITIAVEMEEKAGITDLNRKISNFKV